MKRIVAVLLLLGVLSGAHAQIVKMTASAPAVVTVGERFELVFTLNFSEYSSAASLKNAEIKNLKFPISSAFTMINSQPMETQATSMTMVNGKMSQSRNVTYTFYLQAQAPGTFEIGSASCEVSGTTYSSEKLSIEVIPDQNASGTSGGNGNTRQNTGRSSSSGSGAEIYFRTITDKKTVYQGEAITAQIKLFSKVSVTAVESLSLPSYDGFYMQDVNIPTLTRLERENVNGEIYGTGVLKKFVLFPQKSGEITIDAATMDVEILQQVQTMPRSIFDDFFMAQNQRVSRELTAPAVRITVQPLPSTGKPLNFSGAVGQFSMKSSVDKTSLKANETITLKLTITGSGNLKLIQNPSAELPPDFDTYDPKVTTSIQDNGISGTRTIEYLMIPRHEGTYVIPAVKFSYFNPQTKSYQTLTSSPYTITVEKGDEQTATPMIAGLSREDVRFLGQDIRFIQTRLPEFNRKGDYFFGSGRFFAYYVVSLLLFLAIVLICRQYIRKYADEAFRKYRRAGKSAAIRLKNARNAMKRNDVEAFYEEVSKALWGFLSDKLGIPPSDLSRESATEAMLQNGCNEHQIHTFESLIDTCEMARYAPSAVSHELRAVYTQAADFIAKF